MKGSDGFTLLNECLRDICTTTMGRLASSVQKQSEWMNNYLNCPSLRLNESFCTLNPDLSTQLKLTVSLLATIL